MAAHHVSRSRRWPALPIFVPLLAVALALLVGGVVAGARSGPEQMGRCLMHLTHHLPKGERPHMLFRVIDVQTGAIFTDGRAPQPSLQHSASPDGEFTASVDVLQNAAFPGDRNYALTVGSSYSTRRQVLAEQIGYDRSPLIRYTWAHDSRWLGYAWITGTGSAFMGISDAWGAVRITLRLGVWARPLVSKLLTSAAVRTLRAGTGSAANNTASDGEVTSPHFTSYYAPATDGQASLDIVRWDTGEHYTLIGSAAMKTIARDTITLSPDGSKAAFMQYRSAYSPYSPQVGIATRQKFYSLSYRAGRLLWSPDSSKLLNLRTSGRGRTTHIDLDILSAEGGLLRHIHFAPAPSYAPGSHLFQQLRWTRCGPISVWLRDSREVN